MHAKRLGTKLNRAIVENNASDYCWEQAQRLWHQLNRNAMICDLHQTRIHKKVLRKGRFCLNLIRESPIGRRGDMQIHKELHGEQVRLLDYTGSVRSHPDTNLPKKACKLYKDSFLYKAPRSVLSLNKNINMAISFAQFKKTCKELLVLNQ